MRLALVMHYTMFSNTLKTILMPLFECTCRSGIASVFRCAIPESPEDFDPEPLDVLLRRLGYAL